METLNVRLTGIAPLLMHNGRLANPMDPKTRALKAVTSRKKKTDDEIEEVRRLEWEAGLYLDESESPCVPADVILGAVVEGARKNKLGKKAQAGVFGVSENFALQFGGAKRGTSLDKLYQTPGFCDYRSVDVQGKRVMRARPRFAAWSVDCALSVETQTIDMRDVVAALEVAGMQIGIGDFRPRYGRFSVERI